MKGVDWGSLYNEFEDIKLDTNKVEDEVNKLILDEEVTKN